MQRCLQLAAEGRGRVAPNPMVGCVIEHNGRLIGEGFHQAFGAAHAEVNALNSVAEKDRHLLPEATLYVNLEPCSHFGKTPPCADLIIEMGIKKVVIANSDPFSAVQGRGISRLRQAGVEVKTGLLEREGQHLNRRFFTFHLEKRPYIILKWAQTADGFVAGEKNVPIKITNPLSDRIVHHWRTEEQAILIGSGTALADNPLLTARLFPGPQPVRILTDRQLSVSRQSRLFEETASPLWVMNEKEERKEGHIRWLQTALTDNPAQGIANRLHQENILSLLVEGGPQTHAFFLRSGLWDEIRIFKAPFSIEKGLPACLPQGFLAERRFFGSDLLEIYTRKKKEEKQ